MRRILPVRQRTNVFTVSHVPTMTEDGADCMTTFYINNSSRPTKGTLRQNELQCVLSIRWTGSHRLQSTYGNDDASSSYGQIKTAEHMIQDRNDCAKTETEYTQRCALLAGKSDTSAYPATSCNAEVHIHRKSSARARFFPRDSS